MEKIDRINALAKKQKEEGFVFGGERNFYQVFSNSFIPTIICIYIAFAKMGIVPYLSERIGYQESRVLLCQFIHRYAIASYGFGVLLRMFSRYLEEPTCGNQPIIVLGLMTPMLPLPLGFSQTTE